MLDGVEITQAIREELIAAEECISQMQPLGASLAKAERAYREAKHKRIAYERSRNNTPVSILQDVVKGYADIAELVEARDMAQVLYDANREAELLHKKRADILRDIYVREYGRDYGA